MAFAHVSELERIATIPIVWALGSARLAKRSGVLFDESQMLACVLGLAMALLGFRRSFVLAAFVIFNNNDALHRAAREGIIRFPCVQAGQDRHTRFGVSYITSRTLLVRIFTGGQQHRRVQFGLIHTRRNL
eukprot:4344466-Pleurochrysis_carterae.AAC.1